MCRISRYLKHLETQRKKEFNEYIDWVHQELEKMVKRS